MVSSNQDKVASLFESLMDNMGIEEAKRDPLRALPEEQKRVMIKNQKKREASSSTFLVKRYHKFSKQYPEYYVRKLSEANDKVLSVNDYRSLNVSLSTQAISWVRQFVDLKGLRYLTEAIFNSCNKLNRSMTDLSLEYEIMKCIKSILNTKVGAKSVLNHPKCITDITFALESPSLGVRKVATDILTFICYLNIPSGRQHVIAAMKHIQDMRQYDYIYEVWLRHFTLDIWRGNNDSGVDCNKYDKISSDQHFYEYLESNFIFMNSLIDTCEEIDDRITTRLHMIASGVRSVVHKAKKFGSSTVNYQLKKFESAEESDYLDMCSSTFSWRNINPRDVFVAAFRPVERTKGHKPFMSIVNHLLYAQRNPKSRNNYYRMLDTVIEQIISTDITEAHRRLSTIFAVGELAADSEDEDLFSSRLSRFRTSSIARSSSSVLSDQYPRTPTIDSFNMYDSPVNNPYSFQDQLDNIKTNGVPPPPPPAPAAPDNSTKRTPQKPLKKFNWEKLPEYVVESTLWNEDEKNTEVEKLGEELEREGIFDELEDKFAVKKNPSVPTFNPQKQVQKQIRLLDSKRSYQIDIMLSSLKHLSPKEICDAFLNMDSNVISEDLLENFMKCLPTERETKILESYVEDDVKEKELGRAEAVLIETLKIDKFEEKLKAVYMKLTFNEKAFGMEKSLDNIMEGCNTLKSNQQLAKLLQLILVIGNFMNAKDFRGNAKGFKIQSLERLSDIRASGDSTTLLHFLTKVIEKNFPDLLKVKELSGIVDAASKASFNEIADLLYSLKKDLEELMQNLAVPPAEDEATTSSEEKDTFATEMDKFFSEARTSLDTLEDKLNKSQEMYKEAAGFYGENASNISSENFFNIFVNFLSSFNNAIKDNQIEQEKKVILEKRRERQQEIELRKENQRKIARRTMYDVDVSSVTDDDSDNKGVMDNLLESLRDHKQLSKRREKKRPVMPRLAICEDMGSSTSTRSSLEIDPLSARATELLNQIQCENEQRTHRLRVSNEQSKRIHSI
ncbi:actin-binding FH2 [Basidiobolus meristosporus CBS 931.73]|uniref:Actin-binding FH2 n=1 Tax=Basidiobolus meristosporus CBS 931.73 TaxID=1314790 RepID=A0A1Y1YFL9_9FUNG|nr:actin-binding FH2 [Basidiobolus meristosporus CBS 931.73]|eukprot:ORX96831.1 actin-binding FH2 [Basidiobolus meristosporus CBS 931.73]